MAGVKSRFKLNCDNLGNLLEKSMIICFYFLQIYYIIDTKCSGYK